MRAMFFPGSARVSRAGDGVLAFANLAFDVSQAPESLLGMEVRRGETPQPARETRALPRTLCLDRRF